MKDNSMNATRAQVGVSMIEMLVTLVIISVGLLGVAALQSRGQLATQGAYTVTQAVTLATNIMDKMRVNVVCARDDVINSKNNVCGGEGYQETSAPGGALIPADECTPTPPWPPKGTVTDCSATACNPQALRDFDLNEWYGQLACNLPGGTGRIALNNDKTTAISATYVITIEWSLKEAERDSDNPDDAKRQQQWEITL